MRPAVIADDANAPKGLGRVFSSLRDRSHTPDPSAGQDDAIHEKLSNGMMPDPEPTISGRPEECSLRTQHHRLNGGGGGGHGFAPLQYGAQEELILYRRARMQLMLWRCLTYCMFVALVGE